MPLRRDREIRLRTSLCAILLLSLAACGDDEGAAARGAGDGGAPEVEPGRALGNENRPSGVAHCYTPLSSEHAATRRFWVAFRGGDLAARAGVRAALTDAAHAYPNEQEFALLAGLAHLWRVTEPLPAEVNDVQSLVQAAFAARVELERAYALCPTDHRIPAWLGPVLVNTGRNTGNPALIEQGMAVLEQGMVRYPAFVSFSKLLIFAEHPRRAPEFQHALRAVDEALGSCGPSDPACTNHAHAAHNLEGASVYFGDVLAKGGDRPGAVRAYDLANVAPSRAEWDYLAIREDRLTTLDARIAAFANEDPADDPESVWQARYQCSICHRQ
jgi:hypothetical protein